MKRRKGFTLIEMLVVTLGIAMLSTMAAVGAMNLKEDSNKALAQGTIAQLGAAVSQYRHEMGVYPAKLEDLTTASGVYGPWLRKLPTADPYGTTSCGPDGTGGTSAYCYSYSTAGFAIWSAGKDKTNNSGSSGTVPPSSFSGDDVGLMGQ